MDKHDTTVNLLFSLYERFGNADYIGEEITQKEHALQCADLAVKDKQNDEFIVASLFHDIGHLIGYWAGLPSMDHVGTVDHDVLGATLLRQLGFPFNVQDWVANHVQAKRYIRFTQPDYPLSDGSEASLKHQGGVMEKEEAKSFEENPSYKKYLLLRSYEDRGKVVGKKVPGLEFYRPIIKSVLSSV